MAAIARLGFKRWYERQLIEAHFWLVVSLLIAVAIAVALEGISFRRPFHEVAPVLGFLLVGGYVTGYGVWRFNILLARANRLAEDSSCRACGAYSRFNVIERHAERMRVRCRQCGNEWMLG